MTAKQKAYKFTCRIYDETFRIWDFLQNLKAFGFRKEKISKLQVFTVSPFRATMCVLDSIVSGMCGPTFWRVLTKELMAFNPAFTRMWKLLRAIKVQPMLLKLFSWWVDMLCSNWKDSTLFQSATVPWQANLNVSLLFLYWGKKNEVCTSRACGSSWDGATWSKGHSSNAKNKVYQI